MALAVEANTGNIVTTITNLIQLESYFGRIIDKVFCFVCIYSFKGSQVKMEQIDCL